MLEINVITAVGIRCYQIPYRANPVAVHPDFRQFVTFSLGSNRSVNPKVGSSSQFDATGRVFFALNWKT